MISSRTGRLRAFTALGAAAALSGGLLAATTSQAAADPADPPPAAQCPDAFPHTELQEGQAVTGVTNTRGTTLDSFSGTYVDTIVGGIGRGRDMLVFRLEGSRITKADGTPDAGIWAGISGSPVYAENGELVGSVSYGFNEGNETLAGVTPAEYVYGVKPTAVTPEEVSLSSSRKALARQDVSVAPSASLKRIGTVRQVSGVVAGQLPSVRRIASRAGTSGTFVNGSATSKEARTYPIVAGGSVGVTWSFGDITTASVGSVTAVCEADGGTDVFAFGHPDVWDGESDQSLHGAAAVSISAGTFGSYKLSNVGAPVGRLVEDRLEGIYGRLGDLPVSVDLKTSTTFRGRTVPGSTTITETDELPFITALQTYSDVDTAFNAVDAGGDSEIGWKIGFTRANGKKQSLARSQRYSSRAWLAEEVVGDVASDVDALLENEFEDVTITSISVTNTLDASYRAYRLGKVERQLNGRWSVVSPSRPLDVKAGSRLRLRLTLSPLDRHAKVKTTTRIVTFQTSKYAAGSGRLYLEGGAYGWEDYDEFEDFDEMHDGDEDRDDEDPFRIRPAVPRTLDAQLKLMRGIQRQDQVVSTLAHRGRNTGRLVNTRQTLLLPSIVEGETRYALRFRR